MFFPLLALLVVTDRLSWVTESLSTVQGIMILTGTVLSEVGTPYKVWVECNMHHNEKEVPPYYCAAEVLSAGIRWGIELAALGQVTTWYKRGLWLH